MGNFGRDNLTFKVKHTGEKNVAFGGQFAQQCVVFSENTQGWDEKNQSINRSIDRKMLIENRFYDAVPGGIKSLNAPKPQK